MTGSSFRRFTAGEREQWQQYKDGTFERHRAAQAKGQQALREKRAPLALKVIGLYESGASLRDVATEYDLSASGVRGILIKAGAEIRAKDSAPFVPLTPDQLSETLLDAIEGRLMPSSIHLLARAAIQSMEVRASVVGEPAETGDVLTYQNIAFLCFWLELEERTLLRWLAGDSAPHDYNSWLRVFGQCGCSFEVIDLNAGHNRVLILGDRGDREAFDDYCRVADAEIGFVDETPEWEARFEGVGGPTAWLLRQVRKRAGVSLTQLAKDTAISDDAIRAYERGVGDPRKREPSYERLFTLLDVGNMAIRLRPRTKDAERVFRAIRDGRSATIRRRSW